MKRDYDIYSIKVQCRGILSTVLDILQTTSKR
eukprot:CAMPEP_0196220890 /NCGR_PEP_ID=MMETSP0912-20130531/41622_1 /TAXON_ID=49265 /ORGANISM="Thalassiosira rotula, Strain GSO102" /LENGTH=31 /DNA_ID= /DNA_START= /DNA_END= /DNA_ORIENTATION=